MGASKLLGSALSFLQGTLSNLIDHTREEFQKREVTCARVLQLSQLLLSRFSRVRLCETPETAAYQAPPSLGFSRKAHWSELPFPPPMHESEKSK